jgi:hypothetical protein
MTIDERGLLWLSDPWIAALFSLVIVGLVLWSHCWLETGRAPGLQVVRVTARRRLTPERDRRVLALSRRRAVAIAQHQCHACPPARPTRERGRLVA